MSEGKIIERETTKEDKKRRTIKLNPFHNFTTSESEFETPHDFDSGIEDNQGLESRKQNDLNKDLKLKDKDDFYYRKFKENQARGTQLRTKYKTDVKNKSNQIQNKNSLRTSQSYVKPYPYSIKLKYNTVNQGKAIKKSSLPLLCDSCGMRMRIRTINNTKFLVCSICGSKKEIDHETEKELKLKTKIAHPKEKVEVINIAKMEEWKEYMNNISQKISDGSIDYWKEKVKREEELKNLNVKNKKAEFRKLIKIQNPNIKNKTKYNDTLQIKTKASINKDIDRNKYANIRVNRVLDNEADYKSPLANNKNYKLIGSKQYRTQVDNSAIISEIQRMVKILGKNYQEFYTADIKKREKKYLVFQLYGRHEFTCRSDYGDREYTAFNISKELRELVEDFQPKTIEREKVKCIEYEFSRHNGERIYYLSPAGRHISRIIKPSKRDFKMELKYLLRIFEPINNVVKTSLKSDIERDLLHVGAEEKMCVKCASIFKPISWDGWQDKYLSTNNVYVCDVCNKELKLIINEEKVAREMFQIKMDDLESKKSRYEKLTYIDFAIALLSCIGIVFSSFFLILISLVIIFGTFYLFKVKNVSNVINEDQINEHNRRSAVLNGANKFNGNLLKVNN